MSPPGDENTLDGRSTTMSTTTGASRSFRRVLVSLAVATGVAFGSYGIASAASGSSTATTATTTATPSTTAPAAPPGATASNPWGSQRSDETLLTGDALAKVKAIALDKVSGGTIVRIETDADGHAAYEAHVLKADGSPVTVYVDKDFNFVSLG
jgi:pyruvate/2-oxoglutarate dehydrogenase complex dihydrolipoamide acyltransferase (E2) component